MADKTQKVQLLCTYSDGKTDPGPGTVIEVDAAEAARLIEIGAAKEPEAAAKAE